MKIKVMQEMIDGSYEGSSVIRKALSYSLWEVLYEYSHIFNGSFKSYESIRSFWLTSNNITIAYNNYKMEHETPAVVNNFIREFDDGVDRMKPFEFELSDLSSSNWKFWEKGWIEICNPHLLRITVD